MPETSLIVVTIPKQTSTKYSFLILFVIMIILSFVNIAVFIIYCGLTRRMSCRLFGCSIRVVRRLYCRTLRAISLFHGSVFIIRRVRCPGVIRHNILCYFLICRYQSLSLFLLFCLLFICASAHQAEPVRLRRDAEQSLCSIGLICQKYITTNTIRKANAI